MELDSERVHTCMHVGLQATRACPCQTCAAFALARQRGHGFESHACASASLLVLRLVPTGPQRRGRPAAQPSAYQWPGFRSAIQKTSAGPPPTPLTANPLPKQLGAAQKPT
eukprot:363245-Chlamydomonas_euryale.AAC.1